MKTQRLLLLFSICLFFHRVQAQTERCTCDCPPSSKKPRMIVSDRAADLRSTAFNKYKKTYLKNTFPQEVPLDLASLKTIFAAVRDNISGIRIYFVQTEPKVLSLVFALTTETTRGIHTDDPASYKILAFGVPTATLTAIKKTDFLMYMKSYREELKRDIDSHPPLKGSQRKETVSLFYDVSTIREFYDAIDTGCLKDIVKGVSVKFVTYSKKERIKHDTVTKDVGDKLLLHFVFKDCKNFPIDFNNICYPIGFTGDTDTALPCPDFCTGGIDQ